MDSKAAPGLVVQEPGPGSGCLGGQTWFYGGGGRGPSAIFFLPDRLVAAEINQAERSKTNNSQTTFKKFKNNVINIARKIAKEDTPKIQKIIDKLEKDIFTEA